MARIKINFPEKYLFDTRIDIRISDINYSGHLGNDRVLALAHEARMRFFDSLGYTEMNIEAKGIIMSDAAIEFRSEGFYGDKLLVKIAVEEISARGFDMLYKIERISDSKEIARIKTGILFYDYGNRKITSMPDSFRNYLVDQDLKTN